MRTFPARHIAAALLTCSLLAACGGGGGGTLVGTAPPPTAQPTGTPSPVPSATPAPGTPRGTIRATSQAILAAGKVLGQGGYSVGGPPVGAMGIVRLIRSKRVLLTTTPCSSNVNGSANLTETTDAQGNVHDLYSDYYDANCTQPERAANIVTPPGSSISAGSITGDTTEYDRSRNVTGYATFSATYNATSMTVQTAFSKTVGGALVGRSGATCIAPSQTATNETCGLALYSTVAGTTYGVTESVAESFTTTNNGFNSTATANVTATTYTGAGLTLVAPVAGNTTWGLSGGTQLDSITGTGTATYNGSFVTSASYAINDTTASITASGTITGTSLTVTLTQAGSTVATLVIDADGNGSVTYADSTKETVAGYTIFG
ncbi:MAG: hypothetical protein QOJ39_3272 [Candidatus Eremiobacteraeota bacterium]|jgi:hypothetical protein|nr:hypothetical protein [Candidatus Eremiobacteraeota bacterium]